MRLRKWFIEKLGGYPDLEAAVEAIRKKDGAEKAEILTEAVRKLFNTMGPEDILHTNPDGDWVAGKKTLNVAEQDLLAAEATQFLGSRLWDTLQKDIKYQANKRMFVSGSGKDDLVAGKLWLFTLDAFKTRLRSLSKRSAAFNAK